MTDINFLLILKTLIFCVVASIMHEATHFFVALALRRRPQFNLQPWVIPYIPREWEVFWHANKNGLTIGDYFIAISPLFFGIIIGVWGWNVINVYIWMVPGWVLYTFVGALYGNDLSFEEVDPQTHTHTMS